MATEILVSLIGLAGSALGTFAGICLNTKLTTYRIEQLEKKIEKLNDTLDRIAKIEVHLAALDVRVDTLEDKTSV